MTDRRALVLTHEFDGGGCLVSERLRQRGYGRRLLASLPPLPPTSSIDEVAAFFRQLEQAGYTSPGPPGEL